MIRNWWTDVRRDWTNLALALLVLTGGAYILYVRIGFAAELPLWLDESFTAVISTQPDWTSLLREIHADPSAPLYYLLMWLLPGESNFALRLPGLVFMIGAALLPVVWRIPRLPMFVSVCWGALLFFWYYGIAYSADARPYALLMFVSTAQTIAFARLLDSPSRADAVRWTGIAALAILTHYFAGAFGLIQGLILLAVHRRAALRLWPALLPLVVPAAVLAWHWSRLMVFTAPGVAWYPLLTMSHAAIWGLIQLGPKWDWIALAAVASRMLTPRAGAVRIAWLAALAGLFGIILVLFLGTLRPMVTPRYLTPGIPGGLLFLLLFAGNRLGQLALVWLFLATASIANIRQTLRDRVVSGLEMPSHILIRQGAPRRIVFALDYDGQRVLEAHTMNQLGAYDFRRHGLATSAMLVPTKSAAPLEAAAGRDGAIIWLYIDDEKAEVDKLARRRHCFRRSLPTSGALICPALDRRPVRSPALLP